MFATLTGLGLSTAAGLNAYIPLLVVGVLANFTDRVKLPDGYAWLSNWGVLAVIAVLLLAEVVLDKIPAVDSINDMIQTAVRPASGGVVFSATSAAAELDNSTWLTENPWLSWVLGILVALAVHTLKATARPVVNVGTGGVGAPVMSTVEDAGSLGVSLVAIFIPLLVIVLLIGLALLAWWVIRKVRRRRRDRSPG
ncbi:DUF4126 domain-containing protein [Nonomuraea endophytica]|uniref:Membrane-anchored protein YejM (Alkaline phosphatase superfamily) n=1 Tax=Nonomuraea endophytica TaxID=714136 RepID=A0A7W8A0H0_9ACTN|nr:DUF4126 domain-containing protein [Nonomuraea endophytica]MBB5077266.1 membrane-anchored protein YejM (alkaline phosphatase superfamily) [Nonomuraea endophytica]